MPLSREYHLATLPYELTIAFAPSQLGPNLEDEQKTTSHHLVYLRRGEKFRTEKLSASLPLSLRYNPGKILIPGKPETLYKGITPEPNIGFMDGYLFIYYGESPSDPESIVIHMIPVKDTWYGIGEYDGNSFSVSQVLYCRETSS